MLRPLRDRIVVEPMERKIDSIIDVVLQEKLNLGRVVAAGPLATDVKPGDIIRFGEFKFQEWREHLTAPTYLLMQEADVAAVVEA